MKISRTLEDGKRLYEITLSRRDFDDICSGCPDGGYIVGRHADVHFYIFDGASLSNSWRRMDEGYFITVGTEAPVPKTGTKEEWDKCAEEFYSNLEKLINESGMIPIEEESLPNQNVTLNRGYVTMRVEP